MARRGLHRPNPRDEELSDSCPMISLGRVENLHERRVKVSAGTRKRPRCCEASVVFQTLWNYLKTSVLIDLRRYDFAFWKWGIMLIHSKAFVVDCSLLLDIIIIMYLINKVFQAGRMMTHDPTKPFPGYSNIQGNGAYFPSNSTFAWRCLKVRSLK